MIDSPGSLAFLDRFVLFFGGKGGVGKTTMASALALRSADAGDRTLLVSTDPAHSTSDILETNLGAEPREVTDSFWAMELDPGHEADRYISGVKDRIAESTAPRLLAEVERQIDIARVSPGAEEAALFERFARLIEEAGSRFDRIVFDTAPTGQTLRLLSLPELMSAWIGGLIGQRKKVNTLGRMWRNVAGAAAGDSPTGEDPVLEALEERRATFHRARQVLSDEALTSFVFVLTAERLPIWETEKAVSALTKYGIPVGAVLVNRVLPSEADGTFLERRKEQEAGYLDLIGQKFRALPIFHVPLMERDVVGVDALRRLAASHFGDTERR
jgi:arsenite-transporting ATPase